MAELSLEERLQPSLLDRLTDDEPDKQQESRERRVLSLRKLRDCVTRDLAWLLNTTSLSAVQSLDDFPLAAESVINYGLPELAGHTVSAVDLVAIERIIKQAIWDFEPRILRKSVKVRVVTDEQKMNHNAMVMEIEGELWAQPVPIHLYLKTEMDLETGDVVVSDYAGRG